MALHQLTPELPWAHNVADKIIDAAREYFKGVLQPARKHLHFS